MCQHYKVLVPKKQDYFIFTRPRVQYGLSMIRSLAGTLAKITDTTVVLVVHDVGYLIRTNALRHSYSLDQEAFFYTHLAVRENALDLYGFAEERELAFFELLLTIPKIGPKSALQILCQADPDILSTAILLNDAEHLHKVSGIGKKTASSIVTSLSGKIDSSITPVIKDFTEGANLTTAQIDAIDALVALGYEQKDARAFVLKEDSTLDAKTLIQAALRRVPID